MKVVILAGGLGTRLAEETKWRPKPMVEIGEYPILWHIMKYYSTYGFGEFVIALGYMASMIKKYFMSYKMMNGAISVNISSGKIKSLDPHDEDWVIHLVDTGLNTMTGGRIKRLQKWIGEEPFMVTYGDGLSNIDLNSLLLFHNQQKRIATITAVRPPSKYGELGFSGSIVSNFVEKPVNGKSWINGGFMVFEPEIFSFLDGDEDILERDCLEILASKQQLAAYHHEGFWQCMDTMKDKQFLEKLIEEKKAPWITWYS